MSKAETSFTNLRKMIKLNKQYYLRYIFIGILALVLSVTAVIEAEGLRKMINGATSSDFSLIISGAVMLVSLLIIVSLLTWLSVYLSTSINLEATLNFQQSTLKKLNRIRLSEIRKHHSGDYISRIYDSTREAQAGINQHMVQILQNSAAVIFLIIYLSILNWKLTLVTLFFAGVMPSIMNLLSKKIRENHYKLQQEDAKIQSFIQESIQGAEVVRSFSVQEKLMTSLQQIYHDLLDLKRKSALYNAITNQGNSIIFIGGMLVILAFGGWLVFEGNLDLGALVAFLVAFEAIVSPLSLLLNSWPSIQKTISSAKRVFEIFNLSEEETPYITKEIIAKEQAIIIFDNVSYQYKSAQLLALNDVSLEFKQGEITAIVGPSGSGKSTMLNLLMKFDEPQSGQILYNQYNVSDISHNNWRKNIAFVSQEITLFSDTYVNNIRYGRLNATEEEVIRAAKSANIHETIMQSEDGYQTILKENGSNLSGGQRQRLALARAILRNPLIYIFDEPTSSLDGINERDFVNVITEVTKRQNKFCVLVTHNIEMAKHADYIYMLDDGELKTGGKATKIYDQKEIYFKSENN